MILVLFLLLVFLILLAILICVLQKVPKVRAILIKIAKKMFFNGIVRSVFTSALKMQFAAATVIALTDD